MNNLKNELIRKFKIIYNVFQNNSYQILIDENISKNDKRKVLEHNLKIWNMDTSIFGILKRFHDKCIENSKLIKLNKDKKIYVSWAGENSNGHPLYNLVFENAVLNPSKKINPVAYSTMWQYLRVLNFFDLIIIDLSDKSKNKSKDFIKNDGEIYFSVNIFNLINATKIDYWLNDELIISYIVRGLKKDIWGYKDMAYSIFVSTIFMLDQENLIFSNVENIENEIKFKVNKKIDGKKNNDLSLNDKLIKSSKETYGEFCKFFIKRTSIDNPNKNNLELLNVFFDKLIFHLKIDNLISLESSYTIDNDLIQFKNDIFNEIELNKKIQSARSKLRINILENRNIGNDKYYSDIEPIDANIDFIHDCIEQQEAAHIWSVSEIKKTVSNSSCDESYLDDLSNPSNGILMDHIYHDAFDRGWIRFNMNGEMIATNKWKEKYVDKNNNFIKYPLMKIKENVFNEKMKYFFSKKL